MQKTLFKQGYDCVNNPSIKPIKSEKSIMENTTEPNLSFIVPNSLETYKNYELNLDKIKSMDDCVKVLKFLCGLTIKPLPDGIEYGGFSEVSEYFR